MRQATIYSIAKKLGVSASTVSRAFSRPDLVKASVREQVFVTAEELGYVPNRAARGLATGRTGVFGLLVPDITNPFFPPLVRAVQLAADQRDTEILLIDTGGSVTAEEDFIRRIRPQVDGLIIAAPRLASSRLKTMVRGIPTVVVNRVVRGLTHVVYDTSQALGEAADHLHNLGHRRFALLRGPAEAWAASHRSQAIRSWSENHSDVHLIEMGPFEARFEVGKDAVGDIVESKATAIFAFDDLMAAGVIAGLSRLGESVPEERSIVGCDDVLLARTMTPSLATVTAPFDELGQEAVKLLIEVITDASPRNVRLAGRLALRGTVGPVAEHSA